MLREFSAHQGKLQVPETLAPLLSSLKSCIIFPVVVAGAPPFAMHKVSQAALLTGHQSIACATVLSCLCAWAGVPQTSGKDAFYSKTVFYSNKLGSALLNRIFHPLLQRKMYIWNDMQPAQMFLSTLCAHTITAFSLGCSLGQLPHHCPWDHLLPWDPWWATAGQKACTLISNIAQGLCEWKGKSPFGSSELKLDNSVTSLQGIWLHSIAFILLGEVLQWLQHKAVPWRPVWSTFRDTYSVLPSLTIYPPVLQTPSLAKS